MGRHPDGVIGGRDLQAGGAWFAVDRRRRFGIVTNFREFGRRRRSAPSRGGLIPGYLCRARSRRRDICSRSRPTRPGYAGFNLLLADRDSLWYASNRADQFARELPPGIYGLSNEFLDTPWPKLVRVRDALRRTCWIQPELSQPEALDPRVCSPCSRTARRRLPTQLPPGDLSPEWARKLSAPFVLDPGYGTRCSTVLTISNQGALRITERRFDADGAPIGTV